MRFYMAPMPKFMDTRITSRFLWLPKEIDSEVRWLERATWEQIYVEAPGHGFVWADCEWINK